MDELVQLRPALEQDKSIVTHLFAYYVYDLSPITLSNVKDNGQYAFNPALVDEYWELTNHFPFLVYVGGELAGFALIRRYPLDSSYWDVGQFFVLKKFRKAGVGEQVFLSVVAKFSGKWMVRVLPNNSTAKNFWQKVIARASKGEYQKSEENDGTEKMLFFRFEM